MVHSWQITTKPQIAKHEPTLAFLKENSYICKNITHSKVIFMIIQFSVGNYLSFKKLSTLSLVTTKLKETVIPETDSMTEMGDAIPAVLHGAAIYGANASGKSNFAKGERRL